MHFTVSATVGNHHSSFSKSETVQVGSIQEAYKAGYMLFNDLDKFYGTEFVSRCSITVERVAK